MRNGEIGAMGSVDRLVRVRVAAGKVIELVQGKWATGLEEAWCSRTVP